MRQIFSYSPKYIVRVDSIEDYPELLQFLAQWRLSCCISRNCVVMAPRPVLPSNLGSPTFWI